MCPYSSEKQSTKFSLQNFSNWFVRAMSSLELKKKKRGGTHGRESRDINTYIRTERVRIFFIISLMLSEFSYGKAQVLNRFCSKPFSKGCVHARCSFPHNLEQRQNVFCSRLCRKLQRINTKLFNFRLLLTRTRNMHFTA